jgi:tetratricopeptide (TPR) repeat protein
VTTWSVYPAGISNGTIEVVDKPATPPAPGAHPGATVFYGQGAPLVNQQVELRFNDNALSARSWITRIETPERFWARLHDGIFELATSKHVFDGWPWRALVTRHDGAWQVELLVVHALPQSLAVANEEADEIERTLHHLPHHYAIRYTRGWRKLERSEWDAAAADLGQAVLDDDPGIFRSDKARAFNDLGLADLSAGRKEDAARAFDAAVHHDPKPKYLRNAAACIRECGDLQRASELLARATEAAPKYGRAWYERGELLVQRGDKIEAARCFAKATSLKFDATKPSPLSAFREPPP